MTQEKKGAPLSTGTLAAPAPRYPSFSEFYRNSSKRYLDLTFSLLGLISIAPIMAVVTLIVSLDGGSPVFSHERIGLNGRRFKCLKFRTMHKNSAAMLKTLLASDPKAAAEWSLHHKLEDDPRITGIGKWLRRTSLDELPQLINVIRGDMSLVGPRPVTKEELGKYGGHLQKYLALRPGLTGFWQVHGRGQVSYDERVEMDAHYYWTASFTGDLHLLLATALIVFQRRGQ
jgi:exopolysaccharide production protein ExoY